jgi:Skp family chaperone for outer membrane proteins
MIAFIIAVELVVSISLMAFILWIRWALKGKDMNIAEKMSSAEIRDEYRKEVSHLTAENAELRDKIAKLREQLKQAAERSSRVEQYEVTQEQRIAEFNQRAER